MTDEELIAALEYADEDGAAVFADGPPKDVNRLAATRLRELIAERDAARIEGVRAMREACEAAWKRAQYDPAPYVTGREYIRALDPAAVVKGEIST